MTEFTDDERLRLVDGERNVLANHLAHFTLNVMERKEGKTRVVVLPAKEWQMLDHIAQLLALHKEGQFWTQAELISPAGWLCHTYTYQ